MKSKYSVTLLYICFVFSVIYPQEDIQIPAPIDREQVIHHKNYSLSYMEGYELSTWVAYQLTKEEALANKEYKEKFDEDPYVATGSSSYRDYKSSGYLIGYLAPVQDFLFSDEATQEVMYMSNTIPVKLAFNKYAWRVLGDIIRDWAKTDGPFFIVTGPVLNDAPFPTFGDNKVAIPVRFYKVVLDLQKKRGVGFIIKGSTTKGNFKTFAMSIDIVEKETGIDFFPILDDEFEEQIESVYNESDWDYLILEK